MGSEQSKLNEERRLQERYDKVLADRDAALEQERELKLEKRRLQKEREKVRLTMITPLVKSDGTLSGTFNMEYEGPSAGVPHMKRQWDQMTQAAKASHSVATSGAVAIISTTSTRLPELKIEQSDGTDRLERRGQCTVKIPKGAYPPEVQPVITMVLNENSQDDAHRLTPILKCEPDGLKFKQPVEITLPTCFRNWGNLPMEATVRHKSEHGHWKVLTKLSMDRNTKSFTFCTNHFSQFDVVIIKAKIYRGLVKEKAMIVAVPPREEEVVMELVASVIICDNIGPAKQVANLNNVYETTFLMRSSEDMHQIQVEGENIFVDPQHDMVSGAWHRSKDMTQFKMTCGRNLKQGTTQLHILLNSVAPNVVKVDKRFYLESHHFNSPPPQDTNILAGVLIITS